MLEQMQQYYLDEKNGAIPAFIAAALFLVVGSLLFFKYAGNPLSRGIGTGFLIIVVLLLTVAVSAIVFNNKKIAGLQHLKGQPEQSIQAQEIQRMGKVMDVTFKYAFITFAILMIIALSIVLFTHNGFWKGMGISLMVLVVLAIISDSFSMQRNGEYQQKIKTYHLP